MLELRALRQFSMQSLVAFSSSGLAQTMYHDGRRGAFLAVPGAVDVAVWSSLWSTRTVAAPAMNIHERY